MPKQVYGIGTAYLGRKNVRRQTGACRYCGTKSNLESYSTRLVFTVLYIPLIPIGRKRIVDQCPRCGHHIFAELGLWETARQLEISGALERYRADSVAERAMEAHAEMLRFHEFEQAQRLRGEIVQRFGESAQVQASLGTHLRFVGQFEESKQYYANALQIRADLPEARVGAAYNCMSSREFDKAREHLAFLCKPGAAHLYSLEPLEILANTYRNTNRHRESLEICAILLEALPNIGLVPNFRRQVRVSERALGRGKTILPKRKWDWSELFARQSDGRFSPWYYVSFALVTALVMAAAMVLENAYVQGHRTLYLVNGFPAEASITIDGHVTTKVSHAPVSISLPEGRHHAAITGPVTEDFDFDVTSPSYLGRWFDQPAWVINVGGEAPIIREALRQGGRLEPEISFPSGDRFIFVPDVTYPFRNFPAHPSDDSASRIAVFQGPVTSLAIQLAEAGHNSEVMDLLEWKISRKRNDSELLDAYGAIASATNQSQRGIDFLRRNLNRRPVEIEWHRCYQYLVTRKPGNRPSLAAEYDQLLAESPNDSALCYLRGRVAASPHRHRRPGKSFNERNHWISQTLGHRTRSHIRQSVTASGKQQSRCLSDLRRFNRQITRSHGCSIWRNWR